MILEEQILKELLDEKYEEYHNSEFIKEDPVSIPHKFSIKQDIEISGFWTAILSWGQRSTIIAKSTLLFELMDNEPYQFICQHTPKDLENFKHFKHRTFNFEDTQYFLRFLKEFYQKHESLEEGFYGESTEAGLINFHRLMFPETGQKVRTQKHVSSPAKNSACKRINMFLRWMVRQNSKVDFGIWKSIKPQNLYIPLDVHVAKISRSLGLLTRKQNDWKSVIELTENLKKLDPRDPVKYDYSLFLMGINKVNNYL